VLEFRGSREVLAFISKKLKEQGKKKEGKEVRGIVKEIEGMEGDERNKGLAGRNRNI
jgi:hypothetical protein